MGSGLPAYEVVRRKGQKNLYLRIRNDGSVVVSAPTYLSEEAVAEFVREKERWLRRKLDHRGYHARPAPDSYEEDVRLWYLGERYPVERLCAARNVLHFDGDRFLFHAREADSFLMALRRFELREARRYIGGRVAYWSETMALHPKALRFRRYRSRWGSCAPDDTLAFNTSLIRYAPELIDYVVVHELAHIRHKNHSADFWSLVARYIPAYQALRKRLV